MVKRTDAAEGSADKPTVWLVTDHRKKQNQGALRSLIFLVGLLVDGVEHGISFQKYDDIVNEGGHQESKIHKGNDIDRKRRNIREHNHKDQADKQNSGIHLSRKACAGEHFATGKTDGGGSELKDLLNKNQNDKDP